MQNLTGRVAIITGASRGIGRACAIALAKKGVNIVVAAKTTAETSALPGTIYSVADEIQQFGVRALPYKLDLRNPEAAEQCVQAAISEFGNIDILINNASALWWHPIVDTSLSKYNLINDINARGSFAMIRACLPHMTRAGWGHIINMSPPIALDGVGGRVAYSISKYGMTLSALGTAQEYAGRNIAANCLWPQTVIESFASINHKLGTPEMWRKADIIADAVIEIVQEDPNMFTGNMLIDESYLRSKGVCDFTKYQCVPNCEPPVLDWKGIKSKL